MPDRDRIAARIRALLAKTVENGCTEDEAILAAAKAAEMLATYNMTVDEAQMRETPFTRHAEQHVDLVGDRLWKVAAAISELTGARTWSSASGVFPVEISFFGFEHEVEVARYLLEICGRAMRQQHTGLEEQMVLLSKSVQRRKILPFLDGMADRLASRIRALKPRQPTGTGLILLRHELIEAGLKDAGINLKNGSARRSRDFEDTYRDGVRAADAVALNPGLQSASSVRGRLSR